MGGLTVPSLPSGGYPAGYIMQNSDLVALSAAANFALNKPMTKVMASGVSTQSLGSGVPQVATATPQFQYAVNISFPNMLYDVDGMWNSSNPTYLTIQTQGWYKVRYSVSVLFGFYGDINAWVQITTGPNNISGAGLTLRSWASWAWGATNGVTAYATATGIIPYLLYAGDQVGISAYASNSTNTTSYAGVFGSTTYNPSTLALEYVSTY